MLEKQLLKIAKNAHRVISVIREDFQTIAAHALQVITVMTPRELTSKKVALLEASAKKAV